MDYESVVSDLFTRLPRLQCAYEQSLAYMEGDPPLPYIVFGSVLIPALEDGLARGDLATILPICAFLEDAAESARSDSGLETLLRVEVGEWLAGMDNEALLNPWLGSETKRICRYVPGLATQRRALKDEARKQSPRNRVRRLLRRLIGK
jgi:hypothetical protein